MNLISTICVYTMYGTILHLDRYYYSAFSPLAIPPGNGYSVGFPTFSPNTPKENLLYSGYPPYLHSGHVYDELFVE